MPVYEYKRKNRKNKTKTVEEILYYFYVRCIDKKTGEKTNHKEYGFIFPKQAEAAEVQFLASLNISSADSIDFSLLSEMHLKYLETKR